MKNTNSRKKERIENKLKDLRERLALYRKREKEMLDGGVQSYGVGTRNLSRYNTDLSTVRKAIEEIENEIAELEDQLDGIKPRRAVGVVPRDW